MTYIRTSNIRPAAKRARAVAIACAAIAVIVIGIQFLAPHFLPAIFTTIARPFWRMEFSAASGSLNSPQALLMENESLKNQIMAMQVSQQSVQSILTDNSELLSLLGRPAASSTELASASSSPADPLSLLKPISGRTLAAVLVRPPIAPYDSLILDIGADHGVMLGSKVYAPGGVLIGSTTDVLGQTSKVSLFSSPGETYPVLIGASHIPATAIGRGGGQYEAQAPEAAHINQGDIISDSSMGDGPFGVVTAVISDPADPFETVLFAPPVNLYQLRWVLAETPTDPQKVPVKK